MQQRQLRLGDILDDYCPRERRVTNHAVVAMVGAEVKQTRCTTCDAEHEYKHAKVPRQRRKPDTPAALYAQVLAGAPKKVEHERVEGVEKVQDVEDVIPVEGSGEVEDVQGDEAVEEVAAVERVEDVEEREGVQEEEGPVHRRLIRATLPRQEGQPPPQRPAPEFTIRQPGRPNRFRHRHGRGPYQQQQQFQGGNRSGGGNVAGGRHHQRQKAKGRRQK